VISSSRRFEHRGPLRQTLRDLATASRFVARRSRTNAEVSA
jgi:hypothetical protein